jgi:hypothetical protein
MIINHCVFLMLGLNSKKHWKWSWVCIKRKGKNLTGDFLIADLARL